MISLLDREFRTKIFRFQIFCSIHRIKSIQSIQLSNRNSNNFIFKKIFRNALFRTYIRLSFFFLTQINEQRERYVLRHFIQFPQSLSRLLSRDNGNFLPKKLDSIQMMGLGHSRCSNATLFESCCKALLQKQAFYMNGEYHINRHLRIQSMNYNLSLMSILITMK